MDASGNDWQSPLDPQDWGELRQQGHGMLDDMFDFLQEASVGNGPVWKPIPDDIRQAIREPLPAKRSALDDVYRLFKQNILPYSVGNTHPGFMGWVHGAGTPLGMLAEMLAAGLNANLGGRDHMPVELERQVIRWMSELFSFPEEAGGLFVTGSSTANMIGVLVARVRLQGAEVRQLGVQQSDGLKMVAYASGGAHGCIARAMDLAGLGSANLRRIAQNGDGSIDTTALMLAIQEDLHAKHRPFLIVGTAGSVDTGAVDDLYALASLASRHDMHFHVDGAFGALCRLSPSLAHQVAGIERADSIAMDFHKWMHVPYDAGFVLVRNGTHQLAAFADTAHSYLAREPGGMSDGSPWPCDYGPDLSRGFRALKTWMTLKVYGTERLGRAIEESCERARYLSRLIGQAEELEMMAPVNLSIVCFRYRAPESVSCALNARIVLAIQRSGIAAPSSTKIGGKYVIRAALFNHRTTRKQLEALVAAAVEHGRAFSNEQV